jgi:hypothetical protein
MEWQRSLWSAALSALLIVAAISCAKRPTQERSDLSSGSVTPPAPDTVDAHCVMPSEPVVLLNKDGAVLKRWSFRAENVLFRPVIPRNSALLTYRAAIRHDSADLRRPISDLPTARTDAEAQVWRDERFNNNLAYSGNVGSITPITCLDALLFAHQAARLSEVDHPTEFLASVLRRERYGAIELTVVFGAARGMFPPKSVYGFNVVDEYLADGWSYWYLLHNHTVQRNGGRLALGTPVPSTSDIQLTRSLGRERGLESVRVTNGFYTFSSSVDDLARFRSGQ